MLQFHRIITTLVKSVIMLVSAVYADQEKSVEDSSATTRNSLQLVQRIQLTQVEGVSLADLRDQLIAQIETLQTCRLLLDAHITYGTQAVTETKFSKREV